MKKIKNLKLTSGKKSVLGIMWRGGRVLPFPASGNLPVKDKTILAKTPQFSRFLPNSRLKYGKYVCVRLCQKSSKISAICFILDRHSKNLLCKLTLDGAFSLAIDIRVRLRRVLASKSPPIEKSTLVPCFRFEMVGRQGFAVSRKREPHGKNLLCKLTLGGVFSLAIEIRFRMRRVLASKSPPIEKSTRCACFFLLVGAVGLEPMTSTMSR